MGALVLVSTPSFLSNHRGCPYNGREPVGATPVVAQETRHLPQFKHQISMKITLGVVPYLNALPLYHTLRENPEIEIVRAVPSQLARGLDAGHFDAALLPVVDTFRGHGDGILGDAIIGATGQVRSVLLFSKVPLEQIQSVALDTSSHSSVALLRVIFKKFAQIAPKFSHHEPNLAAMLENHDAALLIGDPALRENTQKCPHLIFDLAKIWRNHTELPFVFAAWTARKNLENREEIARILDEARDEGETKIAQIAAHLEPRDWRETVESYLREAIDFRLTPAHREGMGKFRDLIFK